MSWEMELALLDLDSTQLMKSREYADEKERARVRTKRKKKDLSMFNLASLIYVTAKSILFYRAETSIKPP